MYVRWQSRKRKRPQFRSLEGQDIHWRAIIVEPVHVDGKPRQRHIAYLVGFTESAIKIPTQRCFIWDAVSARLDQLGNQIVAADRKRIEAAIAEKVPRPTPAEYKDIARNTAQKFGWKHITERQRAALKDEAHLWRDRPAYRRDHA